MPRDQTRRARVLALFGLLVILAAVLHASAAMDDLREFRANSDLAMPGGFWGQSLVVAAVTVLAQAVRLQYRNRNAGSVILSLGLFGWALLLPFVSPDALAMGGTLGYLLHETGQRVEWIKRAFNVGLAYSSAIILVATQDVIAGPEQLGLARLGETGPKVWVASIAAIVLAAFTQMVALRVVLMTYDPDLDTEQYLAHTKTSIVIAGILGMFAAACIELVYANTWATFIGLGVVGTLAGGMKMLDDRGRLNYELEATMATVAYRERHDVLTDLPNRRAFVEAVDKSLSDRLDLAVVLLDLTRFRDVNETLGQDAGNMLLTETGRRLKAVARLGDLVARIGGDEFAVLLHVEPQGAVLREAVGKLLAAAERPHVHVEVQVQTGASAGVAIGDTDGTTGNDLLRRAEIAMFAGKDHGERLAMFDPKLEADAPRRLRLAGRLREAIEAGGLDVAYQPKMSLEDGRVIGVEALCRWHDPEDGSISPEEFIPLAERTGLIRPLTRFVVARSLADVRGWRDAGFDLRVAVNVSPDVLKDQTFAPTLAEEILRAGLAAGDVTLEVTESVVLAESSLIQATIARIGELGVKLSIDDYGTGYSSLSYLRRLRVNELKIDRSFVREMITNENDAVLVDSTIKLGHALELLVVAEGVEDLETLQRLKIMGCDRAQGYYIARPMPAADLLTFVRDHDPFLAFTAI